MDPERLAARGYAHLDNQEFDEALEVARELEALQAPECFRIEAAVHAAQEEFEEAVEVLERGTAAASTEWNLWMSLGNYRSDLERYDAAHEAYESALACPGVDVPSVRLNIAIAMQRDGRHEEGLEQLDQATGAAIELKAASERLNLLNRLARHEETIALAEELLSRYWEGEVGETLSWICFHLAEALRESGRTEAARERAWEAAFYNRRNESALWLIRELDAERSSGARHYTLILAGRFHGGEEGFHVYYSVVADDAEEARALAERFEPEELRVSLVVDECEELEACPDEPKGVYEIGVYNLYPITSSAETP